MTAAPDLVDVAVVGAGPAGGSAALRLASSGLRVAVLEAQELPRPKACGGLMPAVVSRLLDCDLEPLVEHRVGEIHNLNNYEQPNLKRTDPGNLLLVDRARFDAGLIRYALEMGEGRVSLHEGFRVVDVEPLDDRVVLHTRGAPAVHARHVIAADGVASRVARKAGLRSTGDMATAVDVEVSVTPERYRQEARRLTFNFFCLKAGYGWIFPKAEPVLSCGVGCWQGQADIKVEMQRFLARNFSEGEVLDTREMAFPIPIWSGKRELVAGRVLLAGDAASLVDPLSGEGIRYAIASGRLAAEAVVAEQSGAEVDDQGVAAYSRRIYELLGPGFDHKRKFLFLAFTQASDYFYRHAVAGVHGYEEEGASPAFFK